MWQNLFYFVAPRLLPPPARCALAGVQKSAAANVYIETLSLPPEVAVASVVSVFVCAVVSDSAAAAAAEADHKASPTTDHKRH